MVKALDLSSNGRNVRMGSNPIRTKPRSLLKICYSTQFVCVSRSQIQNKKISLPYKEIGLLGFKMATKWRIFFLYCALLHCNKIIVEITQ